MPRRSIPVRPRLSAAALHGGPAGGPTGDGGRYARFVAGTEDLPLMPGLCRAHRLGLRLRHGRTAASSRPMPRGEVAEDAGAAILRRDPAAARLEQAAPRRLPARGRAAAARISSPARRPIDRAFHPVAGIASAASRRVAGVAGSERKSHGLPEHHRRNARARSASSRSTARRRSTRCLRRCSSGARPRRSTTSRPTTRYRRHRHHRSAKRPSPPAPTSRR